MEKILQIISDAPLFNGLSKEQLNDVRQISVDKFCDKGKTIFLEGDDCNGFYIVADGKVKIYKVSFEGKDIFFIFMDPGIPLAKFRFSPEGNFRPMHRPSLKATSFFFRGRRLLT